MTTLKSIAISLILFATFSIAIIGFASNFANDNAVYVDINNDTEIQDVYTQSVGNMSSFRGNSESTYSSIINSTLDTADFTTRSGGQFKLTPSSLLGSFKQTLRTAYSKVFGGADSDLGIFLTILFSTMVFIIGMAIMLAWIGRKPA